MKPLPTRPQRKEGETFLINTPSNEDQKKEEERRTFFSTLFTILKGAVPQQ